MRTLSDRNEGVILVVEDDPAVRKAVDDMVYDLYGEENPRPLEDYVPRQGPEMGGQQM